MQDVLRLGDDQVLELVPGARHLRARRARPRPRRPGGAPRHRVQPHRHPPAARRAAPPPGHPRAPGRLLRRARQAALRLHPRQRPEPQRSCEDVEDDVNRWILENHPVHALTTTLDEAKRLGAMALFNEKYGDVVRMVEVGDGSFSRELCGGTHVRSTAEVGLFRILSETSSAANVRRIEAITGPEAVRLLRERDRTLDAAAEVLRVPAERVPESVAELRARVRELERSAARAASGNGAVDVDELAAGAARLRRRPACSWRRCRCPDADALLQLVDRLKGKLGDAAIVLGSAGDGRVDLVASVAPSLVRAGLRAGEIVKVAAAEVGGGGGGRDTLARAGGRDPEQLSGRDRGRPRGDRGGAGRVDDEGARARLRQRALRMRGQRSDRRAGDPAGAGARAGLAARPGPPAGAGGRARRRAGRRRAAAVAVRAATPPRPRETRAFAARWSARCRSRSSSTTSASPPGWPSARADARARTREPRRTCSRAGWHARGTPGWRWLSGASARRGARGGAPRARAQARRAAGRDPARCRGTGPRRLGVTGSRPASEPPAREPEPATVSAPALRPEPAPPPAPAPAPRARACAGAAVPAPPAPPARSEPEMDGDRPGEPGTGATPERRIRDRRPATPTSRFAPASTSFTPASTSFTGEHDPSTGSTSWRPGSTSSSCPSGTRRVSVLDKPPVVPPPRKPTKRQPLRRNSDPAPARAAAATRGSVRIASLIALALAAAAIWFLIEAVPAVWHLAHGRVTVTIPPHSTSSQIGDMLQRDGVISSSFFFERAGHARPASAATCAPASITCSSG